MVMVVMTTMMILFGCRQLCVVDRSDSPRLQQQRPLSSELPGDGGNFVTDSSSYNNQQLTVDEVSLNVDTSIVGNQKPGLVLPLNHTSAVEPLIVHAGAIVSMLHLLPSIACQQKSKVVKACWMY